MGRRTINVATAPAQYSPEPVARRRPARPGDALVSVTPVAVLSTGRRARFRPEPSSYARPQQALRLPDDATIVMLARNFVAAHLSRRLGAKELVGATGVSLPTLRRALMAQTELGIASFIHQTRLDQAHTWLSSNRETRNQAEIAEALGFISSAAFSRSYRRRFGESMTETRKRAVQEADAGIPSGRIELQ